MGLTLAIDGYKMNDRQQQQQQQQQQQSHTNSTISLIFGDIFEKNGHFVCIVRSMTQTTQNKKERMCVENMKKTVLVAI
jgi:hypothetical protein